jgi:hypothetical protein
VGVTAVDNRLFVDAVLYRYRTGIPCATRRMTWAIRKAFSGASAAAPNAMCGSRYLAC